MQKWWAISNSECKDKGTGYRLLRLDGGEREWRTRGRMAMRRSDMPEADEAAVSAELDS